MIAPAVVVQAAFGVACAAGVLGARWVVDLFAPAAGPFSLIYPAVLISTLFGRTLSGLITMALGFLHAWYFVLPAFGSFAFTNPEDGPRTVVNGLAALVILALANLFRATVRETSRALRTEIDGRDVLFHELNHRMKNNFALVVGLLELQKRQHTEAAVAEALSVAAARVHSFAAAHDSLYLDRRDVSGVEIGEYLATLATRLRSALLAGKAVTLALSADRLTLPRDQAVALGLLVNEAVTNSIKHAFAEGDAGTIDIRFTVEDGRWSLVIVDDGAGMPDTTNPNGLGGSLIASFAQMAHGELAMESSSAGTTLTVRGAV